MLRLQDGDQLRYHSAFGLMQIRPGYNRITGLAWKRPRQNREGRGLDRRCEKLEASTAQSAGAAEGADALSDGLDVGRQAHQDRQSFN
jgi:hypothetical protein